MRDKGREKWKKKHGEVIKKKGNGGRREEKGRKGGNENLSKSGRGVVSLVLKRSSNGFERLDTWFWKCK